MKKAIAFTIAALLVICSASQALASVGDLNLIYSTDAYTNSTWIVFCTLINNKIVYSTETEICRYDIATGQTEHFATDDLQVGITGYSADEGAGEDENSSRHYQNLNAVFTYRDELYALIDYITETDSRTAVDGGHVRRIALEDGKAILAEEDTVTLDWSGMVETWGDYSNSRSAQDSFVSGDSLCVETYDDDGNNLIISFDLNTGRSTEHFIQDLYTALPASDGRVLTFRYNWGDEDPTFTIYDLTDETGEDVGVWPMSKEYGYDVPNPVWYQADSDTLYYIFGGEILTAQGFDFDNAVSVNDTPLSYISGGASMTDDGYLLLHDWQNIILRCTDPDKRSDITLHIRDFSYLNAVDASYYDYTNAHGNVSVVVSRTGTASDVLQSMMNRDSSVDIYCMPMRSAQFRALYNRGYLAELDSSETLAALYDKMYPAVSEQLFRDGIPVAVPLEAYGESYTVGVNIKALELLGLTMDDMPKTWDEFLTYLEGVPQLLEGSDKVRAFMDWTERSSFLASLYRALLNEYTFWLEDGSADYTFNNSDLKALMNRISSLDCEALEIPESLYDEETDTWYDSYDERLPLFTEYSAVTMQGYDDYQPLLLTFADETPKAPFELQVAFVNPFSEHRAESIEYLEEMMRHLSVSDQYNFFTDRTEAVHYPDFEEYKAMMAQWLEEARAEREKAAEDEIAGWDETIAWIEEETENIEDTYWMVSPASITNYQARAEYLWPVTFCLDEALSGEGDETFWQLTGNLSAGDMTVDEVLSIIDRKIQMMRLEDK